MKAKTTTGAKKKTAPRYVEFGGLATLPGPYASSETTLWAWFPKVDPDKIQALCRKAFTEPTGGTLEYRPLCPRVMLTFGRVGRVVPTTPGYDRLGWLTEYQVVVFVPTVAIRDAGPVDVADGLAMFVPYIWVDNSLSLATGREVTGWPKTLGWFRLPDENGGRGFALDVFGLEKLHPDQTPARYPLIEVLPVEDRGHTLREWLHLPDALDDVLDVVVGLVRGDGEFAIPGLGLPRELVGALLRRELRQVFLKQIRASADGRRAALQQIVETTSRVTDLRSVSVVGEHDLSVHLVESHPLGQELGLESQRLGPGLKVDMDFVVDGGTVVWDAKTG